MPSKQTFTIGILFLILYLFLCMYLNALILPKKYIKFFLFLFQHNLDSGTGSRYANLSYWKARRVLFYRNGDPYFPGVEFRFKPGRDIATLESLLDKLSLRMDLPR